MMINIVLTLWNDDRSKVKGVLFLDDAYVHILAASQHRQMGRLPGALFELGNEIIIKEHSGHLGCGRI